MCRGKVAQLHLSATPVCMYNWHMCPFTDGVVTAGGLVIADGVVIATAAAAARMLCCVPFLPKSTLGLHLINGQVAHV